jgi:hypothetical protein
MVSLARICVPYYLQVLSCDAEVRSYLLCSVGRVILCIDMGRCQEGEIFGNTVGEEASRPMLMLKGCWLSNDVMREFELV